MEKYDLYSKFDLEKHKQTYVNYLEVVILEDGTVEYAVPSHQMKGEKVAAKKLGITTEELRKICPPEWYFDYNVWLCKVSGAVMVWDHGVIYHNINKKQIGTLRRMKLAGVYKGGIPQK